MHPASHTVLAVRTIRVTLNAAFAYYLVQPVKDLKQERKGEKNVCVLLGRFLCHSLNFSYKGMLGYWLITSRLIPSPSLPLSLPSPSIPLRF